MGPAWLEAILGTVFVLGVGLGPPAFLLWTWRRWGSRKRLAAHAALLPAGVFVAVGAAAGAVALVQALTGPPPGPKGYGSGMDLPGYVVVTAGVVGVYGVLLAGGLALVWAPAAAGWRLAHPATFRRVVRPGRRRARSAQEQDYDDAAAEPGGAPDTGREIG